MPTKILSAEFVTTAVEPAGYPAGETPEVAFVGRSNVGKSSLINALAQRRKLVRVSNTPGRTRALNFFEVVAEVEAGARREIRLCDLPGYGFSRASKAERAEWQRMIETYLSERRQLRAVVCIVDANVGPTPDDCRVVPWVRSIGRRAIVAATKIDKLPKSRRIPRVREIERELTLPPDSAVGVSAPDRIGLDPLWAVILGATSNAPAPAPAVGELPGTE